MKRVLKDNNWLTQNEIKISEIIKKIKNYELYFEPVISSKELCLSLIDDNDLENSEIIEKNNYILNEYHNENSFFFKVYNIKKDVLTLISSYKYLLKSLDILEENHIVNLDLCIKIIDEKRAIITNLERCYKKEYDLELTTLFDKYYSKLPIEAHIICYMNEMKMESLSYENIEFVINKFKKNMNMILPSLSSFENIYSFNSLYNLINKPKSFIINKLLDNSNTWNNYSLSIIYLELLSCVFNEDNDFKTKFTYILILGLKGKRTVELFDEMISSFSEKEWNNIFSPLLSF